VLRQNVGGLDRTIRVLVGLALLTVALVLIVSGRSYGMLLAIVGIMVLGSGLVGFCGLYVPLGISTRRKPASSISPS
jgi:hypothetical protein